MQVPQAINNKRQFRFEITFDNGEVAFLEYRWLKGNMVLMRTLVPAAMRGQGYAAELIKAAFEHARNHELKVIVYCPFINEYLKTHSQYADLLLQH